MEKRVEAQAKVEEEPLTRVHRITDAVTYIVDKDGNEVKQSTEDVSRETEETRKS